MSTEQKYNDQLHDLTCFNDRGNTSGPRPKVSLPIIIIDNGRIQLVSSTKHDREAQIVCSIQTVAESIRGDIKNIFQKNSR